MQSKNAIGNLINKYKAVLKKCTLLNTFGSLAFATALITAGAGLASAATTPPDFVIPDSGNFLNSSNLAPNQNITTYPDFDNQSVQFAGSELTTSGTMTIDNTASAGHSTITLEAQTNSDTLTTGDLTFKTNDNGGVTLVIGSGSGNEQTQYTVTGNTNISGSNDNALASLEVTYNSSFTTDNLNVGKNGVLDVSGGAVKVDGSYTDSVGSVVNIIHPSIGGRVTLNTAADFQVQGKYSVSHNRLLFSNLTIDMANILNTGAAGNGQILVDGTSPYSELHVENLTLTTQGSGASINKTGLSAGYLTVGDGNEELIIAEDFSIDGDMYSNPISASKVTINNGKTLAFQNAQVRNVELTTPMDAKSGGIVFLGNGDWTYNSDTGFVDNVLGTQGALLMNGGTFYDTTNNGSTLTYNADDFNYVDAFNGETPEAGINFGFAGGTYSTKNLELAGDQFQNLDIAGPNKSILQAENIVITHIDSGEKGTGNLFMATGALRATESLQATNITVGDGGADAQLYFAGGGEDGKGIINARISAHGNIFGGEINIESGSWDAQQDISLDKAGLHVGDQVAQTPTQASLDLTEQNLKATSASNISVYQRGTLNLDLDNVGSIDQANQFSYGTLIAPKKVNNNGTINLVTATDLSYTLNDYIELINDIKTEFYNPEASNGGLLSIVSGETSKITFLEGGPAITLDDVGGIGGLAGVTVGIGSGIIHDDTAISVGRITGDPGDLITMENNTSLLLNGDGGGNRETLLVPGDIVVKNLVGSSNTVLAFSNGTVGNITLEAEPATFTGLNVTLDNVITDKILISTDDFGISTIRATNTDIIGDVTQRGKSPDDSSVNTYISDYTAEGQVNSIEGSLATEHLISEENSTLIIHKNASINAENDITEAGTVVMYDGSRIYVAYTSETEKSKEPDILDYYIDKELTLAQLAVLKVRDRLIVPSVKNFHAEGLTVDVGSYDNVRGQLTETGKDSTFIFGELLNTQNLTTGEDSYFEVKKHFTLAGDGTDISKSLLRGQVRFEENFIANTNIQFGDDNNNVVTTVDGEFSIYQQSAIIDPIWQQLPDGTYNPADASQLAVASLPTNGLDGNVAVGRNSHFSIGSSDPSLMNTILTDGDNYLGVAWGENGITAAVGLFGTTTHKIDSAGGTLIVDGQLTTMTLGANTEFSGGTATYSITGGTGKGDAIFADGSLLVINEASAFNSAANYALAGTDSATGVMGTTGIITVADGARLHVQGAKAEQDIYVADFESGSFVGWDTGILAKEVTTNNPLLNPSAIIDPAEGTYILTFSAVDAGTVLPCLDTSMQDVVNNLSLQYGLLVDSPNAGIKLASRVLDNTGTYGFGPAKATEAAIILESAAQPAALVGVARTTMDVSQMRSDAITTRTSQAQLGDNGKDVGQMHLASDGQVTSGDNIPEMEQGLGLWVAPQFDNLNTFGNMCSDCYDNGYSTDLAGITVGADYTFNDAFKTGLAVSLGGGKTTTKGDMLSTENSFYYWGISLYGSYRVDNFTLMADLGYSQTINEISQELPRSLLMGSNSVDVNAHVFNVGLTAEYVFKTDFMDIVPHAGIRYMSVVTNGYDVKNSGTVFEVEADQQSVWYFPVGVTFQKDIAINENWAFTPHVDLGFVAAAGDLHTNSRSSIPGVNGSSDLTLQNVDGFAFKGGLGFDIASDDLKFTLTYNIQASEHETGHGLFGVLSYEF